MNPTYHHIVSVIMTILSILFHASLLYFKSYNSFSLQIYRLICALAPSKVGPTGFGTLGISKLSYLAVLPFVAVNTHPDAQTISSRDTAGSFGLAPVPLVWPSWSLIKRFPVNVRNRYATADLEQSVPPGPQVPFLKMSVG